jgi:small neutral amino acid transporter SnatA (MarC family)
VSPAFDGYPQSFISQLALINPVGAMLAAICRTCINIGRRLMGLMLSALAVEFIVDGLKALLPNLK